MKNLIRGTILLFILGTLIGFAEDGGDFAGFYKLGEPIDFGDEVQIRLIVRIYNCSGYDVAGGMVTLENHLMPGEVYGIFPDRLSVAYGEKARLEGEFRIPRLLFEEWQNFQVPCLRIAFMDGERNEVVRQVALFGAWMEEEG